MATFTDENGNEFTAEQIAARVAFEQNRTANEWAINIRAAAVAQGVTDEEALDKVVDTWKQVQTSDQEAPKKWVEVVKDAKAGTRAKKSNMVNDRLDFDTPSSMPR